jgi:hypothetical protein
MDLGPAYQQISQESTGFPLDLSGKDLKLGQRKVKITLVSVSGPFLVLVSC